MGIDFNFLKVYNCESCGIFRQKSEQKKVIKNEQIFKNQEVLNNLGLELPLCTEIAQKLGLGDGVLTKERLAEELCKLTLKI